MNKFFAAFFTLSLLILCLNPLSASAADLNLIPNPSFEKMGGDFQLPSGWNVGKWGENVGDFSITPLGHKGQAMKVSLSHYISGDIKCYFDYLAAKPRQNYQFSDYYKASVETDLVASYLDNAGNPIYQFLGTVPASPLKWARADFSFQAPDNAQKITIFHLLNRDGSLITDDFSLEEAAGLTITDNVPNSSLEQPSSDGKMPLSWQTGNWGNNQAKFSYQNTGHTGKHSVRVDLSRYKDGDAKWYFEPQKLEPGKSYEFSDFYRSNVQTRVMLMIQHQDGTITYQELKKAPSSTRWSNYKDVFTTPVDLSTISIMHIISAAGFLVTDDYAITPHQAVGFNRPLITLTFDDSWEDNFSTALPVLNQYGFKSTQYYATGNIESKPNEQYKITEFVNSGQEIGSHSVSHSDLTTLSRMEIDKELENSKSYLETFAGAGNVRTFATPYGNYNQQVTAEILKYYQSHRSVDAGFNTRDGLIISNVRVQNVLSTTTIAEYNSWIDQAKKDNSWLVLVYHRVAGDPGEFDTSTANFGSQMESVKTSGIAVKTVSDALAELTPQVK